MPVRGRTNLRSLWTMVARDARRDRLIPTRVKADSLWGFQTGASQTLWWRAGGSPCGQGLRFAQTGIALRPDYDAARLRGLAKASRNAGQSRRLLALAEIYDGGSRTKAARIGGVGLQTLRDWVVRFNAHGPGGLIDGKARETLAS